MGAKVSAEMLKARELILKGVNPAEAARRCGLTRSAIYHSTWYKQWRSATTRSFCRIDKIGNLSFNVVKTMEIGK